MFLSFAIVPVGGVFKDVPGDTGTVNIFGRETFLQVADPPIGILLLLAMSSIAVYGIMLAGWSSGSKYPLIGSVRASAQAISYEAALGMSVVAVVILAGTLSTHDIVARQAGGLNTWFLGCYLCIGGRQIHVLADGALKNAQILFSVPRNLA